MPTVHSQHTRELAEWRVSPRVAIRPGSRVEFRGGGPEYETPDGPRRMRLPGVFVVRGIYGRGKRVWLEAGCECGVYRVFVAGRAYRNPAIPGVLWKPYKVRRMRRKP